MRCKPLFWMLLISVVGTTFPAQAYIDPGTGSLIAQMLVGIVGTGSAMAVIFYRRVLSFLRLGKKNITSTQAHDEREA